MMKVWTQIPTWGIIVIIIGVVFILATIAFIILLKRYLKRKKEFLEEQKVIDSYYKNIIDAVGKIQNIEKVEQVGSRLSFYLKNQCEVMDYKDWFVFFTLETKNKDI